MKTVDIWWMDIGVAGDDTLLAAEELARADRFARPLLRQHYVASHAGLRLILARYLNREPKSLRFTTGPHGKPELTGGGNLHFNLSHSGSHALCAVADGIPVGVDVQHMRPVADLHGLAGRVFSAAERELISECGDDGRLARFYSIWARKEALVKALGLGFSYPIKTVTMAPAHTLPQPVEVPGHGTWWAASLAAPPDYAAGVASREPFNILVRNAAPCASAPVRLF